MRLQPIDAVLVERRCADGEDASATSILSFYDFLWFHITFMIFNNLSWLYMILYDNNRICQKWFAIHLRGDILCAGLFDLLYFEMVIY